MTTTHDTTGLREEIARVICERGGTSWDFYAQEAPLMAEGLREVADAILAHLTAEGLLGAGWTAQGGFCRIGWEESSDDQPERRFTGTFVFSEPPEFPLTLAWGKHVTMRLVEAPAPPQVAQAEGEGS